jgi:hypothetical protein
MKHSGCVGPGLITLQGKRSRVAGATPETLEGRRLLPRCLKRQGLRRLNGYGERPVDQNGVRAELLGSIAGRTTNRKRDGIWVMGARRQAWNDGIYS